MAKKSPRIRRTFTPQFKKDAVALVEAGRSVNEVAHDLGVGPEPTAAPCYAPPAWLAPFS
jgi:transposase-like protein